MDGINGWMISAGHGSMVSRWGGYLREWIVHVESGVWAVWMVSKWCGVHETLHFSCSLLECHSDNCVRSSAASRHIFVEVCSNQLPTVSLNTMPTSMIDCECYMPALGDVNY